MPKVRSVRDGSCWTSFDSFYLPIFTNIRRLVDMRKMISALGIAAATFCFSSVSLAAEQSYPSRPVTLVVPWNAGGSVDMTARRIGEAMTKQGFSVIVENSPGASGTIGLRKVATSAPDGYTLGIATTSLMGAMSKKITPLTTKDFTPLVQMTAEQMVLLVPKASPVKTIEEFVELMKSKSVSFGTQIGRAHV